MFTKLFLLYFSSFLFVNSEYISKSYNDSVSPKLVVTPSFNILNGDYVKVNWIDLPKADYTNKLGLFCQFENGNRKLVRLYSFSKSKEVKTTGVTKIRLFYARSTCVVRYLILTITNQWETVVESKEIKFAYTISTPMHIRISLTERSDQMKIMWVNGIKDTSCVKYYTTSKDHTTQCGQSITYKSYDMCDSPANSSGFIDPGYIHSVVLSNLLPQTRYFYQIIGENSISDLHDFLSPLPTSSKFYPVSLIIFGDLSVGKLNGPYSTIKSINKQLDSNLSTDVILHVGDISYARGKAYDWEEFGYMIEGVASRIPYMVSIGNHEHLHRNGHDKDPSGESRNFFPGTRLTDSGGECSVPMVHRFSVPNNGNKMFWYSFNYGPTHIIMLCSELNFTKGSRQYQWFIEDLENINRISTPWLIVTMHRPIYNPTITSEFWMTKCLYDNIEPLLIKYKVDFFFSGHQHFYRRSCPLNRNSCKNQTINEWGTVHITVGSGGKLETGEIISDKPWILKIIKKYGYGRLNILNSTNSEWTFNGGNQYNVMDSITYKKKKCEKI